MKTKSNVIYEGIIFFGSILQTEKVEKLNDKRQLQKKNIPLVYGHVLLIVNQPVEKPE